MQFTLQLVVHQSMVYLHRLECLMSAYGRQVELLHDLCYLLASSNVLKAIDGPCYIQAQQQCFCVYQMQTCFTGFFARLSGWPPMS